MKKRLVVIFAVLIAASVLAFWGLRTTSNAPPSDKPVIRIVALFPMTGDAAVYGQTSQKVAAKFLSEWEARNPNARYKYDVAFEDVQRAPARAALAANRLISLGKVDVFLSMLSSVSKAVIPIAERKNIIVFSWAPEPSVGEGDYNFRIATDIPAGVKKLLDKIEGMGIKKVSVVRSLEVEPNLSGEEILKQLKSRPRMTVAGAYQFNPGERRFDLFVQKIAFKKPEMIILETLPPATDLFLRSMKRQGIEIPVTGFQLLGVVQDKKLVEGFFDVGVAGPNAAFAAQFAAELKDGGTQYSEYTVTMLSVLMNAFEKVPLENGAKPSAKSMARALLDETNGLETPLGTMSIDKDGVMMFPTAFYRVRNGQVIPESE